LLASTTCTLIQQSEQCAGVKVEWCPGGPIFPVRCPQFSPFLPAIWGPWGSLCHSLYILSGMPSETTRKLIWHAWCASRYVYKPHCTCFKGLESSFDCLPQSSQSIFWHHAGTWWAT